MSTTMKQANIRPMMQEEAEHLGKICYAAFADINAKHSFPCDFESEEQAIGFIQFMSTIPNLYCAVAEQDGVAKGSAFLWEGDTIFGVGPVTVDPRVQSGSLGRKMMEDLLSRAVEKSAFGVRLVQAAFNAQSMALYTKLGFQVREPLVVMQGNAIGKQVAGKIVRPGTESDITSANAVCTKVHGHDRVGEVYGALAQGAFQVVESDGKITGYTTGVSFFGHSVAESNDDMTAMISAAEHFTGSGFLLPSRNTELFKWCLSNGLRVVYPATLMTLGAYQEPSGAFLTSILY